ncbi:MAG: hypothetical protein GF368_05530 [Candidatus Aenigmarchaeota archaeon]|nr:hypothetical protein [Candidatus Aenigmarchaeota archaeon]
MVGGLRHIKGESSYILSGIPDDLGTKLSSGLTSQGLVVTEYTVKYGSYVVATRQGGPGGHLYIPWFYLADSEVERIGYPPCCSGNTRSKIISVLNDLGLPV